MKIRITGIPYDIIFVDDLEEGKFAGLVSYKKALIRLEKNAPEVLRKEALLHEIFHVISEHSAIGLSEKQILALSHSLFQVLEDNYSIDLLNIEEK